MTKVSTNYKEEIMLVHGVSNNQVTRLRENFMYRYTHKHTYVLI